MSNIKFILLPGARGSAPVPRWEHQLPPDPSLVWGPSAPIAVYFQNITVYMYFKSYWQPWLWMKKISQFDCPTRDTSFHGNQISVHMRELAPETDSCNRFASWAYLLPPYKPVWYEGAKVLLCNIFFARNHWCRPGSFAPGVCCRSKLRSKLPRVYRPFTNVSPSWKHTEFLQVRTFQLQWNGGTK